jgi:hypothetical protein
MARGLCFGDYSETNIGVTPTERKYHELNCRVVDQGRHNVVTARGHDRLRRELQRMCAEGRREVAEQLRQARGDGTLDDNPELLSLLGERAGPGAANSRLVTSFVAKRQAAASASKSLRFTL